MNQASSLPCPVPIIAEVNIYQCNPWDLPAKALFGDKEWYFFSPRDRKYPNGARPNRAAGSGYWKATGTDKAIVSTPTSDNIGVKKALVFYGGKPPRGTKTDWIMHEYRLLTTGASNRATKRCRGSSSMRLDDWVLCRIHKKSNNFQFGDPEQEEGSSTVEEESLNNNINSAASPKSDANDGDRDDDDHQFQFQAAAAATTTTMSMSKSYSITDLLNTIDYTALSQLLDEPPLIYPTTETAQSHHQAALHSYNSNAMMNNNSHSINNLLPQVDYVLNAPPDNCNGGLMKRKRVMTVDGGGAESPSSFDDGSSSSFSTKLLKKLPSDSARSSGHFAGSMSGGGGSYCNQQQLVDTTSGGFQQPSNGTVPERSSGKAPKTPNLGGGFSFDFHGGGGYIR